MGARFRGQAELSHGLGKRYGGERKHHRRQQVSVIRVNTAEDLRFNRIAWSSPQSDLTRGVIAAGLETGEVHVLDPEKIVNGAR